MVCLSSGRDLFGSQQISQDLPFSRLVMILDILSLANVHALAQAVLWSSDVSEFGI